MPLCLIFSRFIYQWKATVVVTYLCVFIKACLFVFLSSQGISIVMCVERYMKQSVPSYPPFFQAPESYKNVTDVVNTCK